MVAVQEAKIRFDGVTYVVNLTSDPNAFYIKSASNGSPIRVDLPIAAKLFGAEKAINLLNLWYQNHDANYYTSEWQTIGNQLITIKFLENARGPR